MASIKAGQKFQSRVWLNPADNSPLLMVITRVAQGTVYYRPIYGVHDDGSLWMGGSAHFELAQASRWLGEETRA